MVSPSNLQTPRARGWRPAMARSSVVLPAPLGPMRPRRSPPFSVRETSSTARSVSNWTRRFSFSQFLDLAEEIGTAGVEIFTPMVDGMDLGKLAERLRGKTVVLSQPLWTGIGRSVEVARKIGAKVIRMHLTGILCGDRAE